MSLNTLFISVQNIKDRSGLHANVDEKLVLPEIKTAQDIFILPALGSALYNRLQAGITANDLNADEVILLLFVFEVEEDEDVTLVSLFLKVLKFHNANAVMFLCCFLVC